MFFSKRNLFLPKYLGPQTSVSDPVGRIRFSKVGRIQIRSESQGMKFIKTVLAYIDQIDNTLLKYQVSFGGSDPDAVFLLKVRVQFLSDGRIRFL